MLLALWPLFTTRGHAQGSEGRGKYVNPDITHREIQGKEHLSPDASMLAAEAHLKRLQETYNGNINIASESSTLASERVPDSDNGVRAAAIRVLGYDTQGGGAIPGTLGIGFTAGNAVPLGIDHAIKQIAAKQDDEDMAIIMIMLAGMQ